MPDPEHELEVGPKEREDEEEDFLKHGSILHDLDRRGAGVGAVRGFSVENFGSAISMKTKNLSSDAFLKRFMLKSGL